MNFLLEITLSDWTPSITRYSFHYVKIYETGGKIVLSLCSAVQWQRPGAAGSESESAGQRLKSCRSYVP